MARLLYGTLAALSTKSGFCWASNRYLSQLFHVTPETISRALKALETAGYIRLAFEGDGQEKRTIYIVADTQDDTHDAQVKGDDVQVKSALICRSSTLDENVKGIDIFDRGTIDEKIKGFDNFAGHPRQNCQAPLDENIKQMNIKYKTKEHIHLFNKFWSAYPRKQGKAKAAQAFAKLKPDESLLGEILAALDWQKQSASWTKENGQFIPLPATYLNGRRWEDEKPTTAQSARNHFLN